MNREMDEDNVAHVEEYYNCGYDGAYDSKEKAIIFNCVGRGLKLPPLSQMHFPLSISKDCSKHTTNVRPSHHVLDLMAPPLTNQEPNLSKKPEDKPQSSQNSQHSDVHSESSDHDVYMSDEDDDGADECDSHPSKTDCLVQNPFETLFLPPDVICKTECSSSGNRLVLSETDAAKNEKDDSFTSDDEIYSNPSFGDGSGSDSEDISVATNNLNQTISCIVDKNSMNKINSTGGEKNIYLEEDLSVASTASLGVSDYCQTSSVREHQSILSNDDSSPSETVCLKEKNYTVGEHDSSSSNCSDDPVADMFSSDENLDDLATHFKTFSRNADVNLSLTCTDEFPQLLSAKQAQKIQKPPKQQHKVEKILPTSQLNFKSIAQLLWPNPPAEVNEKSINVETSKNDPKTQNQGVLVVENLPQNYKKNNLDSFLQVFGKVESITLIPIYDKMTARVKMFGDLEWAVECINESNAFGAGAEPLSCYLE